MVISEPALIYLEAAGNRLVRGFSAFWTGGPAVPVAPAYMPAARTPHRANVAITPAAAVQPAPGALAAIAPAPLLGGVGAAHDDVGAVVAAVAPMVNTADPVAGPPADAAAPTVPVAAGPMIAAAAEVGASTGPVSRGPVTADERRAELAAYRGYLHARQRRFSQARVAFAEAATLDPQLALEATPGFWELERSAHEAAVAAYADAGREREGAYLASRLRTTFRPRLVPAPAG